jgi:hypothetical protein
VLLDTYVTNVSLICLLANYLWYFMDEFFVWWSFLLLSCQIYVLHTSKSKNVNKKSRKNFNLGPFFDQLRVGRFTISGTGLPVILTGNQFSLPTNSNLNL